MLSSIVLRSHTTPKSRLCSARTQKALDALQRLDRSRRNFRSALLTAHEAGASKAELARALGVSRQRVDEVLARARHERAAGVEDVTD